MKKTLFVLLACTGLGVTAAHAEPGFSIGSSYGFTKIRDTEAGFDFDATDTGYKLFGAYTFNNNIGIEGGYVDFGSPNDDIGGMRGQIDASGYNLYMVGAIPLTRSFDLFAKAGVVSWDADVRLDGVPVDTSDGNDLALGFGARWNSENAFGIRTEFDWYNISDADAVWMASVGVELRF
jgi:OOP family OmpA-OmpF porin